MRRLSLTFIAALTPCIASADVRLPSVFSDHMVLQRGKPVPVWGWAEKGEKVTVSFAGQKKEATAGDDGRWEVRLDALDASGEGRELGVAGTNEVKIADVLVGEVWVCSGQSNMVWTVSRARDPQLEIPAANWPAIRHFKVPSVTASEPQDDCPGEWAVCSPETVPNFSAVAYFFGRQLHSTLGVPIGLLNASWGGTRSEAWTSKGALEGMEIAKPLLEHWAATTDGFDPATAKANFEKALEGWKKRVAKAKAEGKQPPRRPRQPTDPRKSQHHPSALYNAMLHPLVPYGMSGAIWYQGESNAGRAYQYRTIFPGMITDWREQWGEDFPFYFVQLANFRAPQEGPGQKDAWAELQEAQFLTLKQLENVGMATINDIGNAGDIHPKNKQDVAKRLARWALNNVYGKDSVTVSGPLYKGHEIEGHKVRVEFDHAAGMKAREGGSIEGFEIAGEDKQFVWAEAKVDKGALLVWADGVEKPASVRYAWASNPVTANLVNSAGLPASIFRTDDWDETTKGVLVP